MENKTSNSGGKIVSSTLRLSVRYLSVLFPFNQQAFLSALPQIGFVLPQSPPPLPSKMRFAVDGLIATKGNINLSLKTDKFVLTVMGHDAGATVAALESIENLLKQQLGFDSEGQAYFYELDADLIVEAECDPREVLDSSMSNSSVFANLSKIVGQTVSNYSLRVAPPSRHPTELNWLDLAIEPEITNPTRWYSVAVICRQKERQRVVNFTSELPDTIKSVWTCIRSAKNADKTSHN